MPPTLLPFLKMRMLEPRFVLPDAWPQNRALVLGSLRYGTSPEAFAVEERGAPPAAAFEGAHHWALWVEKRGLSTAAVAASLARWAGCAPGTVGFAGQKDRYAVTGQWFTVPRGVADREPSLPEGKGWRALRLYPAAKKWRRGDHMGNGFRLRLAGAPREGAALEDALPAVLARLAAPIANYFGPQRFGAGAGNLDAVQRWLAAGSLPRGVPRGFLFSAARAYLFNRLLAARIARFGLAAHPDDLCDESGVPTAPLWGRGRSASRGAMAELEGSVLEPYGDLCHALEHAGLRQDRRALWIHAEAAHCEVVGPQQLLLGFQLPRGSFATAVLAALGPASWRPAEAA